MVNVGVVAYNKVFACEISVPVHSNLLTASQFLEIQRQVLLYIYRLECKSCNQIDIDNQFCLLITCIHTHGR